MMTADVLPKAATKASPVYSLRNACMGSTEAARRAGASAAKEEQAKSKMSVQVITATSNGNSKLRGITPTTMQCGIE
jgi:hypothetical protein